MQHELAATCDPDSCGPVHLMRAIQILGVNAIGAESGNAAISAGRTIPWLQDTPAQNVTAGTWHVTNRDVVILDSQNRPYAVFNCTTYDLGVPANYAALKTLMLQAAHRPVP
jgi:hypothetical protein